MNISLILTKTQRELEAARAKAAADERAAGIARQTAQAAKAKLKQARKLSKLAKKSARKADDQSEASLEALDRIQSKLEKLEKRAKKEQRKKSAKGATRTISKRPKKPSTPSRKKSAPPKLKAKFKRTRAVKRIAKISRLRLPSGGNQKLRQDIETAGKKAAAGGPEALSENQITAPESIGFTGLPNEETPTGEGSAGSAT